ncbi:MAG: tetratricopeptide repeat protein [Pseudomonadota bacterium]
MPGREIGSVKRVSWAKMLISCALPAVLIVGETGQARADRLADLVSQCASPRTAAADVISICEAALKADDGRLSDQNRAAVHYNAGVAALDMGREVLAEQYFDNAIQLSPDMAEAWVSRGLAQAAQGRSDAAAASYDGAIARDPDAPGPFLARGRLRAEEGQLSEAVEDYTEALAREPDWEASYFERGRVLLALGRYGEAERDFSAVIARRPRDPGPWLARGEARAANGVAAALNDFDRAVLLAPEWGAARYARGLYLEAAGDADAASADFLRAYQLGHNAPGLQERVRALSGG